MVLKGYDAKSELAARVEHVVELGTVVVAPRERAGRRLADGHPVARLLGAREAGRREHDELQWDLRLFVIGRERRIRGAPVNRVSRCEFH